MKHDVRSKQKPTGVFMGKHGIGNGLMNAGKKALRGISEGAREGASIVKNVGVIADGVATAAPYLAPFLV